MSGAAINPPTELSTEGIPADAPTHIDHQKTNAPLDPHSDVKSNPVRKWIPDGALDTNAHGVEQLEQVQLNRKPQRKD